MCLTDGQKLILNSNRLVREPIGFPDSPAESVTEMATNFCHFYIKTIRKLKVCE
jgi:hypothetical protein